jgi:hypothetical protein
MPRGDGTGPLGNGPIGWGRGGCPTGRGLGLGFGRGARSVFTPVLPASTPNAESLEAQATRLEEQAAKLRNLAKNPVQK